MKDRGVSATAAANPGHVRWFGRSWHAPVCDEPYHVEVPVGATCVACGALFVGSDQGLSIVGPVLGERTGYHLTCFLRCIGATGADPNGS